MVSHHSAQLGGSRHCGSEGVIFLICHVISSDHVSKESLYGWKCLIISHHSVQFCGHRHSRDITLLIRQVINLKRTKISF